MCAGRRPSVNFSVSPGGLANLFGIELWERFSFYAMQALLAYYMYHSTTEGGLGIDEPTALSLVGAYGGFVYMMALVASFVGDRLLGAERTLFYSVILVMVGHCVLALVPGAAGLAIGLVCIGIGSGGVKTATQVVLGDLYTREDPRRDAGFPSSTCPSTSAACSAPQSRAGCGAWPASTGASVTSLVGDRRNGYVRSAGYADADMIARAIARRLTSGLSLRLIGAEFGVSFQSVRSWTLRCWPDEEERTRAASMTFDEAYQATMERVSNDRKAKRASQQQRVNEKGIAAT